MSRLGPALARYLIRRAVRTPYVHLGNYMERYWLVPYRDPGAPSHQHSPTGAGPVRFRQRPLAWVLQQLGIAVRVHHVLRSDASPYLHNHPWNYITVVLRGGYTEITSGGRAWYGAGSVLFRRTSHFHRLLVPQNEDTWTLFISFRQTQSWGFLIPWEDYRRAEGCLHRSTERQLANYRKRATPIGAMNIRRVSRHEAGG